MSVVVLHTHCTGKFCLGVQFPGVVGYYLSDFRPGCQMQMAPEPGNIRWVRSGFMLTENGWGVGGALLVNLQHIHHIMAFTTNLKSIFNHFPAN